MSRYIDEHRGRFGVEPICWTLDVSASAYYQRATGERCDRVVEDERLLELIKTTHAANYFAYGYRRMWKALLRAGESVPRCRVQRLMRQHGIVGAKRRGKPWRTTNADPAAHRRPDLVQRDFAASAPNELWLADFTYLRCWAGVVFFSFVIDAYSRMIVGWQFANNMRTDLVLDALRMALATRDPGADVTLIHHSDAGSQGGLNRSSQQCVVGCDCNGVTRLSLRRSARRADRSGDSRVRVRRWGSCGGCQVLVEDLCWGPPAECLARSTVEGRRDRREVPSVVSGKVSASGEVLAEQAVGVLVGAALPWALRVAEVDLQTGIDPQLGVLGHLRALIPGQRAAQLLGQGEDRVGDRVTHLFGAVPGDRRPVLDSWLAIVGWREVQQHREPARALHQGADRGVAGPEDQVAFPVARDGSVLSLGGPLADHDLVGHEALATRNPCPGHPQRPAGSQARDELPFQRTTTLNVERLVDRLMGDPHRLIIGELKRQPIGNLLRAPRRRPPAVLAPRPVPTLPRRRCRPRHHSPVRATNPTAKPLLHVLTQPLVDGELRRLRPPSHQLRLPLRNRSAIVELPTASRRVATQLPRDRRRRSPEPPRDLPDTGTLRPQQRNLFPLLKP